MDRARPSGGGEAGDRLHPAEARLLQAVLRQGEVVERLLRGRRLDARRSRRGVLVATDRRLLLITRGWWEVAVDEVPYEKINTWRWELGLLGYGRLLLAASGYSLQLGGIPNRRLQAFVRWLREEALARRPPG